MGQYIDTEKLKAEIEKVRRDWLDDSTGLEVGECGAELGAAESILDSIDDIIDSLQQNQPKVDFEKEFAKFNIGMYNPFNSGAEIYDFARHFYELGLNAKRED